MKDLLASERILKLRGKLICENSEGNPKKPSTKNNVFFFLSLLRLIKCEIQNLREGAVM